MELALNFGMPAESLARAMTEREFIRWQHFAARRLLPLRRIELGLAQIAQLIDRTMGGAPPEFTLKDYLFSEHEDDDPINDPDDAEEAMIDAFGFKPRGGGD